MRKLMASAYKEVLLLLRDWGGLAILFFMPAELIITITLIQESTFKAVGESPLPIVLVDEDNGEIGRTVASTLLSEGDHQLALGLREGSSRQSSQKVGRNVARILGELALVDADTANAASDEREWKTQEISNYFDPAAGQTFRNGVKPDIEQ